MVPAVATHLPEHSHPIPVRIDLKQRDAIGNQVWVERHLQGCFDFRIQTRAELLQSAEWQYRRASLADPAGTRGARLIAIWAQFLRRRRSLYAGYSLDKTRDGGR
jgi:hypothetical protein